MSQKPELKLDWCSYEAAKYAVEHWHYSQRMPVGKSVKLGVWECGGFIGCIIFSLGSNPFMAQTVGLDMTSCAELVRVAFRDHLSPVSKILSIAIRLVKQQSPGLRAIVSYADPYHGHHGGIYQASGWLYLGMTETETRFLWRGKILHRRAYTGVHFGQRASQLPLDAVKILVPGKYKYVMPFDPEVRRDLLLLAKPYPKRAASIGIDARSDQGREGGESPTAALQ